jgi:hypothetical protein
LSAVLLWKKQIPVTVIGSEAAAPEPASKNQPAQRARTETSATPAAAGNGNALGSLDRATASSLDALKDQLFRLELRRQAGTISEEEYSRERAKAEQVLRDLVRG